MRFPDLVEGDPLSTTLDRCVASTGFGVTAWHNSAAEAAWATLTRQERADLAEYWVAERENVEWNSRVRRDWERKCSWRGATGSWHSETDEEYERRTSLLKWRPTAIGFEYIPHTNIKRAA